MNLMNKTKAQRPHRIIEIKIREELAEGRYTADINVMHYATITE